MLLLNNKRLRATSISLFLVMSILNPFLLLFPAKAMMVPQKITTLGVGYKKGTAFQPSYLHADDFRIIVSDPVLNQIHQYSSEMVPQNSLGSYGRNAGEFDSVGGVFIYQNKMYACDSGNSRIQVIDFRGAMVSQFSTVHLGSMGYMPTDIAVYADKLFVMGGKERTIDCFGLDGSFETTLSSDLIGSDLPNSLGADEDYLYITFGKTGRTLVLDKELKVKFWLNSKTAASSANKYFSQAVTSSSDEIFVMDSTRLVVDLYSKKTGVFVNSISISGTVDPFDLVLSNKNLVITNPSSGTVFRYTKEGKLIQHLDLSLNEPNRFVLPEKILPNAKGFSIYDSGLQSIQNFKDDGTFVKRLFLKDLLPNPADKVLLTMDENTFYVLPSGSDKILSFTVDGEKKEEIILTLPDHLILNNPTDLAVDADNLFLCDESLGQVLVFDKNGYWIKSFGSYGSKPGQFLSPLFISVARDLVAVSDQQKETVQLFDKQGIFLKEIGGRGSEVGLFEGPIRPTLHDSKIILADSGNHRLQIYDLMTMRFLAFGKLYSLRANSPKWAELDTFDIQANLGGFLFPSAALPLSGGLVVTDWGNSRVQLVPYSLLGDTKIQSLPAKIEFGNVSEEVSQTEVLTLYTDTPFLSKGTITSNNPSIQVSPQTFEHLPIQVRVTASTSKSLKEEEISSLLQISTDLGTSIVVPITASFNQNPDFALQVPSYFVATTDQAIRIPLHVETSNGFEDRITFVVNGVPKNTYPTFEPTFVDTSKSGDLELVMTKSPNQYWEPGVYDIIIEAFAQKSKLMKTTQTRLFLNYSPQEIKRKVLVELFTGIWCTNCTFTHKAINRFNADMGNVDANFIEYYVFSKEDHPKPRLSCEESDDRMKWYQFDQGLPSVYFDGTDSFKGVPTESKEQAIYKVYQDKIENRKKEPSPLSISAYAKYDSIKRTGQISVRLRTMQDLKSFKNPALYIALIESNIAYSAVSGEKMHHLILRDFLRSATNQPKEISTSLFKIGGELILTPAQDFEITLPCALQDFYKAQDMQIVIFVQDQWSKKVLQSFSIPLKTYEIPAVSLAFSTSPVQIKSAGSLVQNQLTIGNLFQESRKFRYHLECDPALTITLPDGFIEVPAFSTHVMELKGLIPTDGVENAEYPFVFTLSPVDQPYNIKTIRGKVIVKMDAIPDFSVSITGDMPESILSGEKLIVPLEVTQNPVFSQPVQLLLSGDLDLIESYAFSKNKEIPNFASNLDIVFKQKALSGSATFSILASGDKNEHSVNFTVAITKNPKYFSPELILYTPLDNTVTNQKIITIQGKTDPASLIKKGEKTTTPDKDGNFTIQQTLAEGLNSIQIVAQNSAGLTSEIVLHITLDTVPPSLEINEKVWETTEYQFLITGKTDIDATLFLDEAPLKIESDGSFKMSITLLLGLNEGVIQAIDPAGNTVKFNYQIKKLGVIILKIGSYMMVVNKEERKLDFPPYIKLGRTMVPLRALSEILSYQVTWDSIEQKIQILREDTIITLWINKSLITITTKSTQKEIKKTIEAAPEIKAGRTFIPLRLISEELGAKVTWDSRSSSIQILY